MRPRLCTDLCSDGITQGLSESIVSCNVLIPAEHITLPLLKKSTISNSFAYKKGVHFTAESTMVLSKRWAEDSMSLRTQLLLAAAKDVIQPPAFHGLSVFCSHGSETQCKCHARRHHLAQHHAASSTRQLIKGTIPPSRSCNSHILKLATATLWLPAEREICLGEHHICVWASKVQKE